MKTDNFTTFLQTTVFPNAPRKAKRYCKFVVFCPQFPCPDAGCSLPATGHFFQIQNGKLRLCPHVSVFVWKRNFFLSVFKKNHVHTRTGKRRFRKDPLWRPSSKSNKSVKPIRKRKVAFSKKRGSIFLLNNKLHLITLQSKSG